jgi:hypothetical protein
MLHCEAVTLLAVVISHASTSPYPILEKHPIELRLNIPVLELSTIQLLNLLHFAQKFLTQTVLLSGNLLIISSHSIHEAVFSTDLLLKWKQVMLASVSKDTRGDYGSGLPHFTTLLVSLKMLAAPWYGNRVLKRTEQDAAALAPPPTSPKDPVTNKHMLAVRSALDFSNTFDSAIWAINVPCTACRSCSRLGDQAPLLEDHYMNTLIVKIGEGT